MNNVNIWHLCIFKINVVTSTFKYYQSDIYFPNTVSSTLSEDTLRKFPHIDIHRGIVETGIYG